ncbi:hypothetical protein [Pantoea leporis]|uniref:hypothetical protein n=1 Tax=Pantoea leporis TaxID=2933780 RepID=UPI002303B57F|nr:hypothetical protein [Pantoea leporis]
MSGTWASKLKLNEFTFKGITNMSCLKKYAYAPFISLLYGVSATASPDLMYDIDKKDYSLSTEVTPQFSWDKSESQVDKTQYCLTPRDPGCSKMWHEEKAKDYSWTTEVTPKLSWEKSESQDDKTHYCLTPSDPGCSNMWHKEKAKEYDERRQRSQQKRLYN